MSSIAQERSAVNAAVGGSITAITPSRSNPNRRAIAVDDARILSLDAAVVESLDLTVGKKWTSTTARAVLAALDAHRARRDALNMLGRRSCAVADLRARLRRREHSEAAVEQVITEFLDAGWLDDKATAEDIINSVLRKGPAARELLITQLCDRYAIDEDVAVAAVDRALCDQDLERDAVAYARKIYKAMPKKVTAATASRRIAARLARRGFDEDAIERVLYSIGLLDGAHDSGDVA
ncbi:MAG: hypothetical protein ACR2GY_02930 [Phycisphaerales bacterium]